MKTKQTMLKINKITILDDADQNSTHIGEMLYPNIDSNSEEYEEYIEVETMKGVIAVYPDGQVYLRRINTNEIVFLGE